jgi:putative transposase
VVVTERQRGILEGLSRGSKTPQQLAVRARIVLQCAEGKGNRDPAMALRVDKQRVSRWRVRWARATEQLQAAEGEGASDRDLAALINKVLSDEPRSGTPAKFSPEQLTAIIAIACEKPEEAGLPVSHWTPGDVAREATKRGIVETISPRHVDRFLKISTAATAQEPVLAHFAG